MVQTFILTRTFAISALVVGAFPITYAAPIQRPQIVVHQARGNYPRGCRMMGCLYALPTGTGTSTAATDTTTSTPSSDDSLGIIDLLISALTAARNSLASTSSTATSAVTVDAVVDPAASSAEDLIESLASAVEVSAAPVVPAVEVTPVESEAASLDALV